MYTIPHLVWLRTFEASARLGSFSAAANELHLTPASVSQQIGLLENHLDTILFKRLARGVELTEAGQAYAEPIKKSLVEISNATIGLFGAKESQTINVRATISFSALILSPKLRMFQKLYPKIAINLTTSIWADHFDDDEIDIDIRYGYGNWGEDNILHLGYDSSIVVCHPKFAHSFGSDLTMQNLSRSEVVLVRGSETTWMDMSKLYNLNLQTPSNTIKADSSLMALQTLLSGIGSAIILQQYTKPYLDEGSLISPFEYKLSERPSIFAVIKPGAQKREEVRIFCDWLEKATFVK